MSNRRRSGYRNRYRSEYLRSPAWHARRDRWFTQQATHGWALACVGCGMPTPADQLELHHLNYSGVIHRGGRWIAAERDRDLVAMHPYCHELLHRLLDRDAVLAKNRDRQSATTLAIVRLRRSLTRRGEVR